MLFDMELLLSQIGLRPSRMLFRLALNAGSDDELPVARDVPLGFPADDGLFDAVPKPPKPPELSSEAF